MAGKETGEGEILSENAPIKESGEGQLNQVKPSKFKNKWVKNIAYWAILNVGVFLLAFGVYMFEAPNHFALGGVGGISIIIAPYVTQVVPWLTQPVILGIFNALLLIIGLIFLGKQLTIRTLICTALYSLEVYLFNLIHPMDTPLTGNPLLELVYAVVLVGSGSAILYNCHASSGGSDIIALIIKKYTGLHIGSAVLATDFLISFLAFMTSVEVGLLSVLGLAVKTFVIDGVIERITKTKYLTIITSHPEVVKPIILDNIKRGFTQFPAKGGYTGEDRTVIITVCRRSQAMRLKVELHREDPTSFVIITDTNEILGKGFAERF